MEDSCKSTENDLNEELREKLDVAVMTFDGPNLARKGNRSTAEFLLDETKAAVQELDPDLDPEGTEFRTAVILMAATCVVGAHGLTFSFGSLVTRLCSSPHRSPYARVRALGRRRGRYR